MIYSIVTMLIKPGMMDAFLEECRKLRPQVLTEEGCRMYDYVRELEVDSPRQEPYNENRITLYEKWVSQDALDLHSSMPYMAAFMAKAGPMRESVTIRSGTEAF